VKKGGITKPGKCVLKPKKLAKGKLKKLGLNPQEEIFVTQVRCVKDKRAILGFI